LAELRRRGHNTVDEPGRRLVQRELAREGNALPWTDMALFAQRAVEMSLSDRDEAEALSGWVFFDRGLIDAATALEHATGRLAIESLGRLHRYHGTVFLTPPWPEIYLSDRERRHDFTDAVAEYQRLERVYPMLGYRVVVLPRTSVEARADMVLAELDGRKPRGE